MGISTEKWELQKKNQMEIQELKSKATAMKSSPDRLSSLLKMVEKESMNLKIDQQKSTDPKSPAEKD